MDTGTLGNAARGTGTIRLGRNGQWTMDAVTMDTRTIGAWDNENGTVGHWRITYWDNGTVGQWGERAMVDGTMHNRTMPWIISPR
jgi:hypothetical protein